jgi:hypothetical protein
VLTQQPRVVALEHEEGVVACDAGSNPVRQMGAEDHLAEAGGVALGGDRHLGSDVLEQRRHQPHVVRLDQLRLEGGDERSQVRDPGLAVQRQPLGPEVREPAARIGHDVAHPGQREVERRRAEVQGVDPVAGQAAHLRIGVVSRCGHRDSLIVAGRGPAADHGVQSDAAAGE